MNFTADIDLGNVIVSAVIVLSGALGRIAWLHLKSMLTTLDAGMKDVAKKVEDLTVTVGQHDTRLHEGNKRFEATDGRVDKLEGRMEKRVDAVEEDLDRVERDLRASLERQQMTVNDVIRNGCARAREHDPRGGV